MEEEKETNMQNPNVNPAPVFIGNANINLGNARVSGYNVHIGHNIYQAAPNSSPLIDHVLVLQRLQKSLRTRYQHYTHLERLFDNTRIPIADSFINLALIKETEHKAKEQNLARAGLEEKDDGNGRERSGDYARERSRDYVDERMASHEQLYVVNEPLVLTDLFEPKDDTKIPNKILIVGRAGIGKSILCQYLATQWASDATDFVADAKDEEAGQIAVTNYLQKKFDAVFWLKLREVAAKATDHDTLVDVIDRFCLSGLEKDKPTTKELRSYIKEHSDKILFILDGYDEITDRIDQPEYRHLNRILAEIASQQHVLLTSRPITIDTLGSQPIQFDRRLENMGFLNENIEAYVYQFMHTAQKPEQAERMLDFLKAHPGVWGIAHIPINLELLSWLWSKGKLTFQRGEIITLSKLYETIVGQVQKAYIRKTSKRPIARALDDHMESKREDREISTVADHVNEFLERLAYSAMETETLFISAAQIKIALKKTLIQHGHPSDEYHREQLLKSATDKLGFLRAAGQCDESQLDQEHYFIHLSFQEFYAAKYITRILSQHPHGEESEQIFQRILTEKYTPHYQLMLWMSAGLLYQHGKKTKQFSSLLRFWRAILSQPRDMIGFHHNILVMHCLDECEADDQLALHQVLIAQQWKWFALYAKKYFWSSNLYIKELFRCSILLASTPMLTRLLEASQKDDDLVMCRRVVMVRCNAVRALGRINDPSEAIIAVLLRTLRDKNENLRDAAADALGQLHNPSEAVIQALINALADEEESVKRTAAGALGKLNNPSVAVIKALLSALRDEGQANTDILGKLHSPGAAVIETLRSALQGEDWKVRKVAADALGKLNNPSEAVIKALLSALGDKSRAVRQASADALGRLNNPSTAVVETLRNALRGKDRGAREAAASALGQLNNFSAAVIEDLLNALRWDKDRDVRQAAAGALGKLDNPDAAVIEALLSALRSENWKVRKVAAEVLGQLKNPTVAVIETLLDALQSEDCKVRKVAAEALGQLKNPSEAVIKDLLNALRDTDEYVRSAVVGALGQLKSPSEVVIKDLINALRDENNVVRFRAVSVLGQLKSPSEVVVKDLLSALRDKDSGVRQAASSVLEKLDNPDAAVVEALLSALQDKDCRISAASALGKLKNPSEAVIEALLSALRDVVASGKLKNPGQTVIGVFSAAAASVLDPSGSVIGVLLSPLRDKACDSRKDIFSTALSTPKGIQATTYIFNQFMRDEKGSFNYFSCWFEKDYLLVIDHSKRNVVARQGSQNYSIPLPPPYDLTRLEKQIMAVAGKIDCPSEFYNLSGGSSSYAKKAILQGCEPGTSVCFVSDNIWLAYIVRKKIGQRMLLIVEGMAAGKHLAQCYEFVLSQSSRNPSSGFFPPGGGIGYVVETRNFLDILKKDKQNYQCKSWDIEPVTGQRLLQLIEADASSPEMQRNDCFTWVQEKLKVIELPIEGRWTDFTVVLPAVAPEKFEKPTQAEENACRLM